MTEQEQQFLLDGVNTALSLVDFAFPVAGPVISIIKAAIPAVAAAAPYIKRAVVNGESAVAAAEAASPGLAAALAEMLQHKGVPVTEGQIEKLATIAAGFHRMTPEEERKWMDDTTAWSQDSRNGSG